MQRTVTPTEIRNVAWPDALAFRESVQNAANISIPEWTEAEIQTDRFGLPLAYSGRFAVAFPLAMPTGKWALRCFTTPDPPMELPRAVRYGLLARRLPALDSLVVPFRFVERGVRIGTRWYPALAMRWADGTPLGRWVEIHRCEPESLKRLAETLGRLLATLEAAGIAHGDWQHDNLLVSETGDRVTLVDYDGVFVPDLAGHPSPELGHANYQHPARTHAHFGVGLDRFACQSLRTALLALADDPALWERFGEDDAVLFRADDFRSPETSPVFAALRTSRAVEVRHETARLEAACRHPEQCLPGPAEMPPLPLSDLRMRLQSGFPVARRPVSPVVPSVAPPVPYKTVEYRRRRTRSSRRRQRNYLQRIAMATLSSSLVIGILAVAPMPLAGSSFVLMMLPILLIGWLFWPRR